MNIGAKVYRMALNSSASHGDDDTDLEWIHSGEEVVKHSDYETALKRILDLEEHGNLWGQKVITLTEENADLKEQVRVRAIALADAEHFLTQIDPVHWPDRKAARELIKTIREAIAEDGGADD